jgi:hypothetical protein
MFKEELLQEKLKYLIMSELQGKFEILDFRVEFSYSEPQILEAYDVDVKFDYLSTIDSQASDFGYDINKMSDTFRKAVQKYQINKEGKIVTNSEYLVSDGMIWGIEFQADTKHVFEMSFNVNLWLD